MRKSIYSLVLVLVASPPLLAQTQQARMPAPPTTHILAIGHFTRTLTSDEWAAIMPHEVPDTLRLILAGKIDQSWLRHDQTGVIFLMNVTDVDEAHKILERLPLGQAKLMEFDLIQVGPLTPLAMLLNDKPAGK